MMEDNSKQRKENKETWSGWELKKVYNDQVKDDDGVITWQLWGGIQGREDLNEQTEAKSQNLGMDWLRVVKEKNWKVAPSFKV